MRNEEPSPLHKATGRKLNAALILLSAFCLLPSSAWGQTPAPAGGPGPDRKFDPTHIKVEAGYKIEVVAMNLSVPTTATFDGNDLLVAESGWAKTAPPRIVRITPDGQVKVEVDQGLEGPVTGLLADQGKLYVSHKGKVSVLEGGALKDIVTGLPSNGDHQNNEIVKGPDGKIYMAQGTVTNSAVVGVDSYIFGWLPEHPQEHEIPCKDVTLVGENFETENPLTPASLRSGDKVTTGAYKPFGTPSTAGEVIKGDVKCGGSVVRFNPDGTGFELVAWGLRNPYGLAFDAGGQLWATYHGADVRGSRNIFNDPDYMVDVKEGAWYGWPEYFDGLPVTDPKFDEPTKPKPNILWKDHPELTKPWGTFETHAGINGLAFSPGGQFGHQGDAFIAMFGTYVPVTTGVNIQAPGFKVVRVDMDTKEVHDFAANVLPGPAYVNQQLGFDRPSDVVFAPDGSLYVIDWGASTVTDEGLKLTPLSGAVWRIYPESGSQLRPNGAVKVEAPPQIPEEQRKPEVRNVPEAYEMIAGPLLLVGGVVALVLVVAVVLWRSLRRRAA
jgi:glucose/arabinose dehydrogenase